MKLPDRPCLSFPLQIWPWEIKKCNLFLFRLHRGHWGASCYSFIYHVSLECENSVTVHAYWWKITFSTFFLWNVLNLSDMHFEAISKITLSPTSLLKCYPHDCFECLGYRIKDLICLCTMIQFFKEKQSIFGFQICPFNYAWPGSQFLLGEALMADSSW